MKIVAAFDSFKESMSAYKAGEALMKAFDQEECVNIPMADGGEGTLESLNDAIKGKIHLVDTFDPYGRKIKAEVMIKDDLAIIESAKACGLDLLSENEKDVFKTSTYGLGELIKYCLSLNVKKIMITLGGSSTNDGGIGMLSSLGISFLDKNHQGVDLTAKGLKDIDLIDTSMFSIEGVEFIGLCDVSNPLCGKNGASYIFGPQKGLLSKDVEDVDQAMKHYALKTSNVLHHDYSCEEGTGAAGGLGFAIVGYLNGHLEKGIDQIIELTHLEDAIKDADIVFTGEGKMDKQTQFGKTPYGVLKVAKKYHKKVVAFAGLVEDENVLKDIGFDEIICINKEKDTLENMLRNGSKNLYLRALEYKENNNEI